MSEQPPAGSPAPSGVAASLHSLAELLRAADHLEPEAQQALADLVDELGNALHPGAVAGPEMTHLADSTTHLLQALHQQHDTRAVASARGRLEQAIVGVEAKAPGIAGIARRLVDALSNIGI
jgi:hypothetical protein